MSYYITANCVGCALCARSCPVGAVSGQVKARHVINERRCVNCGVCGRVCAKGAVLDRRGNICERTPRDEWPAPAVDTSACTACSMCVEACGKEALSISMPRHKGDLAVFAYLSDPKSCVGCGVCADVCPMGAIYMVKEVKNDTSGL